MSNEKQVEKLYDEVSHFIDESRALLEQNAIMEMAGLDKRVLQLCQEALLLNDETKAHHAQKMQEMLDRLTELGQEIVRRRNRIGNEMVTAQDHRKAVTAYFSADAVDNFGKKKKPE